MSDAGAVEKAERRFASFHWGRSAKRRRQVTTARTPRALVELGQLEAIEYGTHKTGDGASIYRHTFGGKGKRRPRLAVDVDGDQLHVIGGDYTVQARGIVD